MVWIIDWTLLVPPALQQSVAPTTTTTKKSGHLPVDIVRVVDRFAEGLQSNYTPVIPY
jgi:hypothetical protein